MPHATIFLILACIFGFFLAWGTGANDVANAVGPIAAIVSMVENHGAILTSVYIPYWILILGAVGIVMGLAMYGYRVIGTIGKRITALTPARGFSAQLATATTVMVASGIGLPVSTTQVLVGALIGVGFAKGIQAVNLRAIRNIFLSWVITIPTGAVLAATLYYCLKWMFHT